MDTAVTIEELGWQGRIAFVGDMHGELYSLTRHLRTIKSRGIDLAISVGDLGYNFAETPDSFNEGLQRELTELDLYLLWVDGNHENHPWLRTLPRDSTGFAPVTDRILWTPRGHCWTLAEKRFGAAGGALSVNASSLVPQVSWFPRTEEVLEEDVERFKGVELDVLVAHDVPAAVSMESGLQLTLAIERRAQESRTRLQTIVELTGAKRTFSGHWHRRKTVRWERLDGGKTTSTVLGLERQNEAVIGYDLFEDELFELY